MGASTQPLLAFVKKRVENFTFLKKSYYIAAFLFNTISRFLLLPLKFKLTLQMLYSSSMS